MPYRKDNNCSNLKECTYTVLVLIKSVFLSRGPGSEPVELFFALEQMQDNPYSPHHL